MTTPLNLEVGLSASSSTANRAGGGDTVGGNFYGSGGPFAFLQATPSTTLPLLILAGVVGLLAFLLIKRR